MKDQKESQILSILDHMAAHLRPMKFGNVLVKLNPEDLVKLKQAKEDAHKIGILETALVREQKKFVAQRKAWWAGLQKKYKAELTGKDCLEIKDGKIYEKVPA